MYRRAELFAVVPFPGHPLGIAVDDGTIYVATHRQADGAPGVASHIYAYNRYGDTIADWTIEGQTDPIQGLSGLALDAEGVLYVVDQSPSRVITLNPRTGEQHPYAELPDVPLCGDTTPDGSCSAAGTDRPAAGINLVFGPDGHLYIGDLQQALIWRVPPGGGTGEVWYTSRTWDSLFGPNTVRFINENTLLVAESAHGLLDPADLPTAKGRLYTMDILPDGSPGTPELFWEGTRDGDTPDGFAISENGNVYVALAVGNQVLMLDRHGREIKRFGNHPFPQEIPFDLPGGVAFFDNCLLVTNQVFLGGPLDHQVVFSLPTYERGRELFRPEIGS